MDNFYRMEQRSIADWGDKAPKWLVDAKTENAAVTILSNGVVVWHHGTWLSGTWEGTHWVNGDWRDGTWSYGNWHGGNWHDGVWHDGVWEHGIWSKGLWRYGEWKGGTWYDGTWLRGTWRGGVWAKGTWRSGAWVGGMWIGGTFYDIENAVVHRLNGFDYSTMLIIVGDDGKYVIEIGCRTWNDVRTMTNHWKKRPDRVKSLAMCEVVKALIKAQVKVCTITQMAREKKQRELDEAAKAVTPAMVEAVTEQIRQAPTNETSD